METKEPFVVIQDGRKMLVTEDKAIAETKAAELRKKAVTESAPAPEVKVVQVING